VTQAAYPLAATRPSEYDGLHEHWTLLRSGVGLGSEQHMVGRLTSVSKLVFGPPHTFGWVRCSEIDKKNGLEAWERPDGTIAWLLRGAQLGRLPGSRSQPVIVHQRKRAN